MKSTTIFSKIFKRLLFSFSILTILILLVSAWNISNALFKEYILKGNAIAESIADAAATQLTQSDASQFQDLINKYEAINGVSFIYIMNENNQPKLHSFPTKFPQIETSFQINETSRYSKTFNAIEVQAPILYGTLGTVYVGMDTSLIIAEIIPALLRLFIIIPLMMALTMALLSKVIQGITHPLKELSEFTKDCKNYQFDLSKVKNNNIEKLTLQNDEIGTFCDSFLELHKELDIHIEKLTESSAKQSAINKELSIAKQIQTSLLPNLETISSDTLSAAGFIQPAKEVGGDFYDVIEKDNKTYIIIGDVSGKGVAASLIMAATVTSIRSSIQYLDTPTEIMGAVNQQLCKNNPNSMFVTTFLGVIDDTTGQIEYVNAGHPSPIVKANGVSTLESTKGIAFGINEYAFYPSKREKLKKDSQLFLYTDGVTEAHNKLNAQFGLSALSSYLEHTNGSISECNNGIINEINRFTDGQPPHDDITLLSIGYSPASVEIPNPLTIAFKNDISELTKLQHVTEQFSDEFNIERKVEKSINLILEELLTNIIFYGYRDNNNHEIFVKFAHSDQSITINIEDDGIAFNPLTDAPEADTTSEIQDRKVGGLGVHIVKKMASSIDYERSEDKNKVTIVKEFA